MFEVIVTITVQIMTTIITTGRALLVRYSSPMQDDARFVCQDPFGGPNPLSRCVWAASDSCSHTFTVHMWAVTEGLQKEKAHSTSSFGTVSPL